MPNWCVNKLSVKGNKDEVAKVKALFINDKDKVDFNIVTPMSPNLDGVTDSHSWKKNIGALSGMLAIQAMKPSQCQ